MKFKSKTPSPGKFTEIKFLLWPRRCEDGYIRWLERVNKSYVNGQQLHSCFLIEWRVQYDIVYTPLTHEQRFNKDMKSFLEK